MRDIRIWLATFTYMLLLGSATSAYAQPVDNDDYETLRRQVAELQAQLKNGAPPILENKQVENNERVRNVGRQIVKRKPRFEEDQDIALQIRLYDLSDLFAVSPNYPATIPNDLQSSSRLFANSYGQHRGSGGGGLGGGGGGGGGFGGGGGGVFRMAPTSPATPKQPRAQEPGNLNMQAAQVTLNQLVETVKETVKPEMWGTSSTSARIKFLGNTLLVTATEDMHEQINNLLNLFREHWGKRRTVSIQTWWIRTDQGEAFNLIEDKVTKETGAGVVSKDRWEAFFTKAKDEKKIVYAATLTGHNNQTLHALSGKQVRLTVDALPLESANTDWHIKSAENLDEANPFGDDDNNDEPRSSNLGFLSRQRNVIGFRPVETSFHEGAAIQVTPLATRGGNFVILDFQAKVNELVKGKRDESVFTESDGKRFEVQLDDTDYLACRFNSTLRCPKDEVVLAGSMTWDPAAQQESPEIYMFFRATVHTIEEDQSDWKQTTVVTQTAKEAEPADSAQ